MTASEGSEERMIVVVPARNAEATLARCVRALKDAGVPAGDIVVVDDGSTDATAEVARDFSVKLIEIAEPRGAAGARNTGAFSEDAAIVTFVDADVAVRPDAIGRLRAAFEDKGVDGVFGSYDDAPLQVSVVSRYRNLLHHYVHQRAPREAITFWTGLGAIRAQAFRSVGGFDASFDYLEDVDLGLRLHAAGYRLRLDPAIQGKHLKVWTLASMIRTDFRGRAIPWARLMRSGRIPARALNTGSTHRASAVCVAGFPTFLVLGAFWPPLLVLAGMAALGFLAANLDFFRLLARNGGWGFALAAAPYHAAHYLAGLAGYLLVRSGLSD